MGVIRVIGSSPAAKAGLKFRDVIIGLDGRAVSSQQDFRDALAAAKLGADMKVTVMRPEAQPGGKEWRLEKKELQIPNVKDPFFTYVTDTIGRGANLEIIMGDARLSMDKERPEASALYTRPKNKLDYYEKRDVPKGITREQLKEMRDKGLVPEGVFSMRDNYYKVIVVDAFSSDAIPIHLITKEAIELYFSKLAPDGVLCVHTSNRHMNLVAPVSDIARLLGKAAIVGHDTGGGSREIPPFLGHFGSEYVMLANDMKYLPKEGTIDLGASHRQSWDIPIPPGRAPWTDDFSNIVSILR
jgi:hypothetical protein